MNLSPLPIQKFFDNAGKPLNGGLLFTYVAGTTTKQATYQNQAGTPNTNPIVLNFRGEANVWLDQTLTYKFVLSPEGDTDPPTRPIWTVDNISAAITFISLTKKILGQILFPTSFLVDGASLGEIAAADAAALVAGDAIIFSAGTYAITSNTTIASNIVMQPGAMFAISAGVTLKLLGNLEAPPQQIFVLANPTTSVVQFGTSLNQWPNVTPFVYPEYWGAGGVNGTGDDTNAVQVAFNSQRPVQFRRNYPVTQVEITFDKRFVDFNGFRLLGIALVATKSVLDIKCGHSNLVRVDADAQFNPLYECAIHWYTNNLNLYYPGFNTFFGLRAQNALIGLCIGGLPTQSIPLPAQGAIVANGLATDAPLSESGVFGYQAVNCIRGIWATQPNGKVDFHGAVVVGTHADPGWSGGYGGSGYTNASTCALIIRNAPTQNTELYFSGGSIEQNTETTGNFIQIGNGNLRCSGTTLEAQCASYFSGFCQVSLTEILNFGFNFPAPYAAFLIDPSATGYLNISDTTVGYSAGMFSSGTKSFVQGASSSAGTFAANFGHFVVNLEDVELRDVPFIGGPTAYIPLAAGVTYTIVNSQLTSYNSTPARIQLVRLNDLTTSLLNGVVDASNYSITAYAANGNAASGGYTFAVSDAVNCKWGSEASGLTVEGYTIDKALHLSSFGAARTTTATSTANFSVEPERTYQVKGWIKTGTSSGGRVIIRTINFQFGGGASATATSTFLAVPDTVFTATFQQLQGYVTIPKDTTKVQFFLYCENGADLIVAGLELV